MESRPAPEQLRPWRPDNAQTRLIRILAEDRRGLVEQRTRLCNQLQDRLKQVFPLALEVLGSLTTELAAEFLARYRLEDGSTLKLPLEAGYRLLAALGEPEGRQFEQQRGRFKKVQSARNTSWLAHGTTPGTETGYRDLREVVLAILGEQPAIPFAMLNETE